MRNKLFTLFLFVCLFGTGIFALFADQRSVSELERRPLNTIEQLATTTLIDHSFQGKVESVLVDQFAFRDISVKTYYQLKMLLYRFFDNGLDPLQVQADVIKLPASDYYIRNIIAYNQEYLDTATNKGYNLSEIAQRNLDVHFYVYKPTRLEETSLLDNDYIYSFGSHFLNDFTVQLQDITFRQLEINSIEEYFLYSS